MLQLPLLPQPLPLPKVGEAMEAARVKVVASDRIGEANEDRDALTAPVAAAAEEGTERD